MDDSLALGIHEWNALKILEKQKAQQCSNRNVLVGKDRPAGGHMVSSIWAFEGDTSGDALTLAGN